MKNITFIRIPKNASTSIYSFFGETNLVRNDYLSADNSRYLNVFESSHCTIAEASELLGDEILDSPVLAVTRNPYDRLVSMFFFARKHDLGRIYDVSTDTFDEFAEQFYALHDDPDFFHSISQKEFMAHEKLPEFTICRFENLEDDIASFIKNNDLEGCFDINEFPKLNSTEHRNYSNYYSDKSKSVVKKMWGDDLDCFSYSF